MFCSQENVHCKSGKNGCFWSFKGQYYNRTFIAKLMQKIVLRDIPPPFTDIFQDQVRQTEMRSRSNSTIIQAPSRNIIYQI